MKNPSLLLAALCVVTPVLSAQDDKKKTPPAAGEHAMPDPKTKEHDALKVFVGDWDNVVKMSAMPGVPGMEKATETKGTEHNELICNGLFLKSVVNGTFDNKPFQGVFIAGYDTFKKTYTTLWIDSNEPSATVGTGAYDEKKKTFEFTCNTTHGPMRSVVVVKDADNWSETCYSKGQDGKESVVMDITRKRAKGPTAGDAAAKNQKPAGKELEQMAKAVGEWDASIRMQHGPDAPFTEEKGTERIELVCNGKWLWSDFRAQMMGAPFEGHAIAGYDATQKKAVSFWLDSMSATWMQSTGSFDEAKKTSTMEGKCLDPEGKPMTSKMVETWKDDNTRVLKMEFTSPEGTSHMEITYKRKGKG